MKKKVFSLLLAVAMVLCLVPFNTMTVTAETEKVVYITSAADLADLATKVNTGVSFDFGGVTNIPAGGEGYTFVQTAAIDLSAYQVGTGWMPIGTCTWNGLDAEQITSDNADTVAQNAFKGSYNGGNFQSPT